jgi:2Fe-2S ferredoxin
VTYVQTDGRHIDIDAVEGDSVMTTATANLVTGIVGDCGGGMSCATCHVFVEDAWLDIIGRRNGDEDAMLETTAVESSERSRLSCQIQLDGSRDGLVVYVPERQE